MKKEEVDPKTEKEQFPAQKGKPEVEVEKRSPDAEGAYGDRFHKAFVVTKNPMAKPDWSEEHLHEGNYVGVLQEALNNGLHPKGEVKFDGSEDLPDGRSIQLNYSVEVVPASTDTEAADTNTPTMAVKSSKKEKASKTS